MPSQNPKIAGILVKSMHNARKSGERSSSEGYVEIGGACVAGASPRPQTKLSFFYTNSGKNTDLDHSVHYPSDINFGPVKFDLIERVSSNYKYKCGKTAPPEAVRT
jgi:hypothetical protein